MLLEEYKKNNFQRTAVIDDYHSGYDQLIEDIHINFNDVSKIKAAIAEINKQYARLYELDYRASYFMIF